MRKNFQKAACSCLLAVLLALPAFARELVSVGQVVGLEITGGGVHVSDFQEGLSQRAQEAGLQIGDRLLEINGQAILDVQDVQQALNRANGRITLLVSRGGEEKSLEMEPVITKYGPKLGVFIRQGLAGVGTVTWFDPETMTFGALGHGIHGSEGEPLECRSGRVYRATVASVKKGKAGQPGQLRGSVDASAVIGTIERNTVQGIFGKAAQPWEGERVEVATWDQIRLGPAQIRSNVQGSTVKTYQVEILKLYSPENPRSMVVKVTDPELLALTGGIVQGMSGSPILQDGRIIGAVTHVLVNSPDTGYGIFIENMLNAAA